MTKKCAPQLSSFRVIFLVGPTAVGKTDLSFYLAEKLSASILNCDSISMYKGLDIGSAKPRLHIKRIPTFLFDEWEPPFTCTAGLFRKKALSILEQELNHRSVLAVGGSGFYIQALEKGMYPIKEIKPEIKQQVTKIHKEKGLKHLYKLLQFLDPEYAKQIPAQDSYRIFRGVCIILSEEKPISLLRSSFKEQKLPWSYLKVGLYLPREVLLKNVLNRTGKMIKEGLLEETQTLLDKGFKDWPLMRSVGYKEAVLFLSNQLSKEELKNKIVHRTMYLAKKQMSWFKRDKNIYWYLYEPDSKIRIYNSIKEKGV
ncbi:MAG: tRNA (adenosine(37)-N6)-dimethylallyltransferase MiaA [Bdellovibrionales bacterium]|nr:tRNA (adenosine(37)-N6)-dimethylallyltransferase MiaA [Bdellovibrionales bacterium]